MSETRQFGDYNIIKQIGQGPLGAVYLAEHRFMKRHHVLKVLPEELATDRSFVQRLEEEVSILSSLDHPNIVKIHNISFAQGQYFLVTDCIVDELGETTNLAQYMLSRPHSNEEFIVPILRQIADALAYAHHKKGPGKGIAHRGIKLNNILVGANKAGTVNVYLSDFGLSRIIGSSVVLTRTYQTVAENLGISGVLATPKTSLRYPSAPIDTTKLPQLHLSFIQNFAFLAPEQKKIETSHNQIDFKADIYAFGILTYYLLMGEFPEGYFEMPSSRNLGLYDWDRFLKSCLQRNPEDRPENLLSAFEMITKVSPHLEEDAQSSDSVSDDQDIPQKSINKSDLSSDTLKPILRTTQLERPDVDLDPASVFQIDTTVKYYVPERKEIKNTQPLLTEMKVIRGGNFFRGSSDGNRDETPRHQVTLDSFAIDIHPVTNEQFVRFLEAMGGEKDSNHLDIIRLRDSRIKRSAGKLSIESGYTKHPVVGVTWYGAVAYAKWIGKRLPTEAEWEIASYGGLESPLYPTGGDIEKTQANFFSSDTTPVMSYAANEEGLFDIPGNVYEWCHDWYSYNSYEIAIQEPENPKGPMQGVYRVLRGGCWKSLKEDLRCSRRHRNNPGTVNSTYGFRCAADVQ